MNTNPDNEENLKEEMEQVCSLRLTANLTKDWFAKLVADAQWRLTLTALSRWSHWITPAESLADNLDGTIPLSPPTLVTLHELLKYQSLKDLQTESRQRPWGQAIFPRLVPLAKGAIIVEPWMKSKRTGLITGCVPSKDPGPYDQVFDLK